MSHLFTSESVFEGHPDKIADQISDAVLDEMLKDDPHCRSGCETFVTTGLVLIAGEITTSTYVDVAQVARDVIRDIGYTDPNFGFEYRTCAVLVSIDKQSPDIAQGVDTGGAGDQGLMVGFACKQTPELMPLPIQLAHDLSKKAAEVRRAGTIPYLRPDGKCQVTVEYADPFTPKRVQAVVFSTQHNEDIEHEQLKQDCINNIIRPVLGDRIDADTIFHVNPTGKFVTGGPVADAGMTGRKIIVDSYGGYIAVGGGAFSGKEPMKVDRSAAYMARYIAKNIVAADLADECEIQLAYAIGVAEPVSIYVRTNGTGKVDDSVLTKLIRDQFDLTPRGIIDHLDLQRPIYKKTACYGHFGREEPEFTWERKDKVDDLVNAVGKLS
ncbi:methionine adenosyltransferase [Candidatus Peregrinibacteria bacterium]|jgi:S-adenosylmethionine synthetase|nr:methionine adenosyltransferase [Candidatus Peregrinibacteria bacterium]MBT3599215.1 methionine adenosyltransferase [Candidatus Peregrinibacteria bacterium]MBT4367468.1 methionine adenosyltransferase [Candidatus Peregrinibacteria bacterium]MBT4585588.1 methionine adenosyltransferase [Candidatus Peregrinibacteria bacterium]MBT6731016.1 methionine adenosyltransferase [Candidatus Peregrinibacteria bacterium]